MAAYDLLIDLTREYLIDLGYNHLFIEEYISNKNFKEMISIRLANANVMIKNKTDRSSHQTHIAITGEAVDFFYTAEEFSKLDSSVVEKRPVRVIPPNISALKNLDYIVETTNGIELIEGYVTLGKRTQKQVQLSKRNSENSDSFNSLRLGLYENDLLIILKYRKDDAYLAIGIPQTFYLDYIPNYAYKYDTNTYLRIPLKGKA